MNKQEKIRAEEIIERMRKNGESESLVMVFRAINTLSPWEYYSNEKLARKVIATLLDNGYKIIKS